jgi:hypothetical protein
MTIIIMFTVKSKFFCKKNKILVITNLYIGLLLQILEQEYIKEKEIHKTKATVHMCSSPPCYYSLILCHSEHIVYNNVNK